MHDWHFAAWHAVASRNRLASMQKTDAMGTVVWVSPEELFFNSKPSFKHHVAFGARCRVLLVGARAQARGTFRQRAILGRVYLWGGHGIQVRGVFRYVLGYVVRCDDGQLLYSRDVWVNETDLVEGGHSSLGAPPGRPRPRSVHEGREGLLHLPGTVGNTRFDEPIFEEHFSDDDLDGSQPPQDSFLLDSGPLPTASNRDFLVPEEGVMTPSLSTSEDASQDEQPLLGLGEQQHFLAPPPAWLPHHSDGFPLGIRREFLG